MSSDFVERWRFVRTMTVDFIRESSDECLDFRPGPSFMTIREQAAHLSEVQGVYQLALCGDEADWARKPEFAPTSQTAEAIIEALVARDRELDHLLALLAPRADDHRIAWYGSSLEEQPPHWTLLWFEADEADAHPLAEALADALDANGGWYADFHSDSEVTVVFAGRVFRYHSGDRAERAKVADYARSVAVPEEQLDWAE